MLIDFNKLCHFIDKKVFSINEISWRKSSLDIIYKLIII